MVNGKPVPGADSGPRTRRPGNTGGLDLFLVCNMILMVGARKRNVRDLRLRFAGGSGWEKG